MKLTYLAISISNGNPVIKKINDWVDAAIELGLDANSIIIEPNGGFMSYLKFNLEIIKSKNKILLIRNPTNLGILLFFSTLIARINNCKIIIDIPTPIYALVKEILGGNKSKPMKYLMILQLIISSSAPFLFSNKIIQYSKEHWWFKIGCSKRIILIGNGVNVKRIKIRKNIPSWPSNKLILIGVASVATWHGYDRIINAILEFNKKNEFNYKIYFNIVGDGPELAKLKNIVTDNNLDNYIKFYGLIHDSEYIETIYSESHLAVSSLGLFRIGLETASVLKSREYVAIGIPFIYAGDDIDFINHNNFRYKVSNNEGIDDLVKLFETFSNISFQDPFLIRKYAEDNLSIKQKLKNILSI